MQAQKQQFAERLARINDPLNVAYRDPETGIVIPKHVSKKGGAKTAPMLGNLGYPMSIILAVVFGCLTVLLARYVRFHFIGLSDTEADPDMAMAMDAAMGIAVGLFLRQLFQLKSKVHSAAQSIGITAMILGMHNLVWLYPDPFSTVFAQDWVSMVKATTTPESLMFRGVSFTL